MIETPTLKTFSYRGYRVYIRKLSVETFEYLISIDNEIFCNQVEINRKAGQRMAKYQGEELDKAISLMKRTAELFIDDKLFQMEEYNRIRNIWARLVEKGLSMIETLTNKLKNKWQKKELVAD